ncbi:hypothetical protein CYMTET_28508 [Cymbomonas tetramitiformis]|uniref:Uncharacterized protein n=1 Tax=Cymbomonas tetramitiformis TaxID=36881 RepID=A0AAE0KVV7_9CHLO|nr:hypothetical protein CYMTET_28508 [Cymbomonas tetramitiformis]
MGRKGIPGLEYDDEGSYSDDFEEVEEDIQESRNASPGKASRAATSGKVNRPVTFAADLSSSGILELPWLSPPPSRMVRSGKSQGKDRQFELFSRGDIQSACPSEPAESICPEEGLASRPFSVVTPLHPRDESYVALEALGMQPITPASAKNRIYAEYIEDDFDDYGIGFGALSARGSGKLPGEGECGIMTPQRPEMEGERGLSAPGTTREEWKNREASPEKHGALVLVPTLLALGAVPLMVAAPAIREVPGHLLRTNGLTGRLVTKALGTVLHLSFQEDMLLL